MTCRLNQISRDEVGLHDHDCPVPFAFGVDAELAHVVHPPQPFECHDGIVVFLLAELAQLQAEF